MIKRLWRLYGNAAAIALPLIGVIALIAVFGRHILIMPVDQFQVGRDRHRDFLHTFTVPAPQAVMMLGDSITQNGRFHHAFPDQLVLNYGVGGDTTYNLLARMDDVLRSRPSKLFLMIGTNDVHHPITPGESIANVRTILERLRTVPYMQIHLLPVTPRAPKHQKKIEAMNAGYQALAAEFEIPYIDLYTPMLAPDGGIKPQYSNDEQHFTGAGYKVWVNAIRPYIEEDVTAK